MGSGRGSWANALRPLRRARVYPDLLGLLQRVRAFFLCVSFVRGGISVAAWRTSRRDFGTRAQHCVGARHLLCSSHSFELEIRLHHSHRFLNPDYSVFDCGGVAFRETGFHASIAIAVRQGSWSETGGHSCPSSMILSVDVLTGSNSES